MSLRRKTMLGLFWSGLQTGGSEAISTIVFLLLARLLQPEAFGLVAFAGIVIAFLEVFVKQGFGIALVQRPDLTDEHKDAAFWANIVAALVMGGATVAFAEPAAVLLGDQELAPVLRVMAGVFPLTALTIVPDALLTREMRFRSLALRTGAAAVSGGAVGVALAVAGAGVWSLVAMQLVGALVGTVVLWGACEWRPRARFSPQRLRELASFSVSVAGVNLVGFAQARADEFIIGSMLGATALGYYHIAQRLVQVLLRLLAQPLASVGVPAFSAVARDAVRLRNALLAAAEVPAVVAVPVFVGLAAVAPETVEALLGDTWTAAATPLRWLAISATLRMFTHYGVPLNYSIGRPGRVLLVTCIELAYSVVVFPLAAREGVAAVSIAHAVRSALLLPVWLIIASHSADVTVLALMRAAAPALIASGTMVGAVTAVKLAVLPSQGAAISLCVLVPVGIVTYALTALVLFRERIGKYGKVLWGGS